MLNKPQFEFIKSHKKFMAFVGGYRSGKTFVGCVRMCVNALEFPGIPQGYFAPTYPQITDIFFDTMLVDRTAAIKFLRDYPLRREVKGITRTIVASILNIPVSELPTAFEKETPLVALETTMPSEKPQAPLSVPTALWKGKTKEHICAVLREKGWDKLEIAHVLFHKRELTGQRAIGKLLHDNPHLTDFAYDKYGKMLFEESKRIVIVDEE